MRLGLLQGLEEAVGRGVAHLLRIGDDPYHPAAFIGLEAYLVLQGANLVNADVALVRTLPRGALRLDHPHVRKGAGDDLRAWPADAARPGQGVGSDALQGAGKGASERALAYAGWAHEEQSVGHAPAGQRPLQRRHGPLVPDNTPVACAHLAEIISQNQRVVIWAADRCNQPLDMIE